MYSHFFSLLTNRYYRSLLLVTVNVRYTLNKLRKWIHTFAYMGQGNLNSLLSSSIPYIQLYLPLHHSLPLYAPKCVEAYKDLWIFFCSRVTAQGNSTSSRTVPWKIGSESYAHQFLEVSGIVYCFQWLNKKAEE